MIISSDSDAGQAVSASEDTRFYDDVGCLARDRAAHGSGARLFVHEARGAAWIPVENAWFARSARLRTPMGHGLWAYSTEEAARAAADDGRVLRWTDVVSQEAR